MSKAEETLDSPLILTENGIGRGERKRDKRVSAGDKDGGSCGAFSPRRNRYPTAFFPYTALGRQSVGGWMQWKREFTLRKTTVASIAISGSVALTDQPTRTANESLRLLGQAVLLRARDEGLGCPSMTSKCNGAENKPWFQPAANRYPLKLVRNLTCGRNFALVFSEHQSNLVIRIRIIME